MLAERARIVLACAEAGSGVARVAAQLGPSRKGAGSIESDGDTIETPAAAGCHTLQVRERRYSSRELSFQVTDGQVISFRCHGQRITPIFLLSFVVPRWALKLRPEQQRLPESKSSYATRTWRAPVDTDPARTCELPPGLAGKPRWELLPTVTPR